MELGLKKNMHSFKANSFHHHRKKRDDRLTPRKDLGVAFFFEYSILAQNKILVIS